MNKASPALLLSISTGQLNNDVTDEEILDYMNDKYAGIGDLIRIATTFLVSRNYKNNKLILDKDDFSDDFIRECYLGSYLQYSLIMKDEVMINKIERIITDRKTRSTSVFFYQTFIYKLYYKEDINLDLLFQILLFLMDNTENDDKYATFNVIMSDLSLINRDYCIGKPELIKPFIKEVGNKYGNEKLLDILFHIVIISDITYSKYILVQILSYSDITLKDIEYNIGNDDIVLRASISVIRDQIILDQV